MRPATATTVAISRGFVPGRPDPDRKARLLGLVGQIAVKSGLGQLGAKAAQAIAVTEGGLEGDVGDLESGGSFGPFQFNVKGQLPNFAAALGVSVEQAKTIALQHPETAIEWALRGYLGGAIRQGLAAGLSGPRLASYAQRVGQVSESPERAGANYAAMFTSDDQLPYGLDRPDTYGYKTTPTPDDDLVPNQFGDPTLTPEEAVSACGPAAAVAFARKWGRNPSLREALDLAKTTGWTQGGGMNGLANQEALINRLAKSQGIEIPVKRVDGAPDWDAVVHDAMLGNPVIVSTDVHYYVIDGYDPQTQQFHVGQSGVQRKAIGRAWATAADIQRVDGTPNGALFVDHPLVPGRSVAGRDPGDGSRDDWRATSRPVTNNGYGFEDWRNTPLDAGAAPGQGAYPTDTRAPTWDPYDTPGWRAARAINEDFTYGLPQRQQAFMQQNQSSPSIIAPSVGQELAPAYESPYADLLDPKRGVPFLSDAVTAPRARRY